MERRLTSLLKKQSYSLRELAKELGHTQKDIRERIRDLRKKGVGVKSQKQRFFIPHNPEPGVNSLTLKGPSYKLGLIGDSHLCSKYERLDVLENLYDIFEAEGIDTVLHAGNWIEGEARFNTYDVTVRGMDDQIQYLADHYPSRSGITTYSVAGDDHEGWYAKREGIDIGKHAEHIMHDFGRTDWRHLDYMESYINLQHPKSKKIANLLLMHPGGGSSYAVSYRPQKIVESFSGGEKPAVLVIGHYHKISYNRIRNVHAIQVGCQQDQTPFMRKKLIDAHIGGVICELKQDEKTGAIFSCKTEFICYFNKGFANNRWNYTGPVSKVNKETF